RQLPCTAPDAGVCRRQIRYGAWLCGSTRGAGFPAESDGRVPHRCACVLVRESLAALSNEYSKTKTRLRPRGVLWHDAFLDERVALEYGSLGGVAALCFVWVVFPGALSP